MKTRLLYLYTRTPLHVGAGSSVGAIDQPVQRERHTGFPLIPGSSLKGSFADSWNETLETRSEGGDARRVRGHSAAAWLFGSDDAENAAAGALLFSEARLLAFPIRSARGSYAWITCPLMLQRAARDGVLNADLIVPEEPNDEEATFQTEGPLALEENGKSHIVLEEYCFSATGDDSDDLARALADLVSDDTFASVAKRLVVLSNGMMTHFATTACEVAQHVRISDETGAAEGTGLFNQENVPADALFYSIVHALPSRLSGGDHQDESDDGALDAFEKKVRETDLFQFGGDASTGLGFTTVTIHPPANASSNEA